MKALLVERDLWQAIGTEVPVITPGLTEEQSQPVQAAIQAAQLAIQQSDAKAKAIIELHVSPHLLYLVREDATARQAWDALSATFATRMAARVITLRRELSQLRMEPKESVAAYYGRVEKLREQLVQAGEAVAEQEVRLHLLAGLPNAYSTVVELLQEDNRPLHDVLARLQITEARLPKRNESQSAATAHFASNARTDSNKKCLYCHKLGHIKANCRKLKADRLAKQANAPDKSANVCGYCGIFGHSEAVCRKKRSDADKQSAHAQQAIAFKAGAGGVYNKYASQYDPEDFQLEPRLFAELTRQYGPCTIDGCADVEGHNALVPENFCTKERSFLNEDLRGHQVWLNPPFRRAGTFLHHYVEQKAASPTDTSALIVLPIKEEASWWPLTKGWKMVRRWEAGTQLFRVPYPKDRTLRLPKDPCGFPVAVFYDPPTAPRHGGEALHTTGVKRDQAFVVDSGATHHITNDRSLLVEFTRRVTGSRPTTVRIGDGRVVPVQGYGTMPVQCTSQGVTHTVTFSDVLYVPEMHVHLLSLSRMDASGAEVSFRNKKCTVSVQGAPVLQACLTDKGPYAGLYLLHGVHPSATSATHEGASLTSKAQVPTIDCWHKRMAHMGLSTLQKLPKVADGVSFTDKECALARQDNPICSTCQLTKMTRVPHVARTTPRASTPLLRVHADVCGPMGVKSVGGSRYYILLIDEATRFSLLETVPTKAEATKRVLPMLRKLERLSGHQVQHFRTDRGGEFTETLLNAALKDAGIVRELTPAHSPESNALVERANRTIMEKVRALLKEGQLPNMFWAEAAVHANLLRNVSPTAGSDRSPHELLLGSRPDLSKLRIFGSLAYIRTPEVLRKKLDPKATTAVLLGSTLGGHYRYYSNSRVDEGRDLVIDEHRRGWVDHHGPPTDDISDLLLHPFKKSQEPSSSGDDGNDAHDAHDGNDDDGPSDQDSEDLSDIDQNQGDGHEDDNPEDDNDHSDGENAGGYEDAHSSESDIDPSTPAGPTLGTNAASTEEYSTPLLQTPTSLPQTEPFHTPEPAPQPPQAAQPRRSGRVTSKPKFYNPSTGVLAAGQPEGVHRDPGSLKEAMESPEKQEWLQAMQVEYDALVANGTWTLGACPEDVKPIPCKWVFKTKFAGDGTVERYKARLVAGGHRQDTSLILEEDVFAPVSRFASLRMVLALAALQDMHMHSLDISNAFLNGKLEEPIYMKQPAMFQSSNPGQVCILQRTLYGLKESPKAWYNELTSTLIRLGFECCADDEALWINHKHNLYMVLWVDDMLLVCKNLSALTACKSALLGAFKGRDLGPTERFLNARIGIDKSAHTVKLSQPDYIANLLKEYSMEGSATKASPMAQGGNAGPALDGEEQTKAPYAQCVGALLYLANFTRPDISFVVSALARHMTKATDRHWAQAKHVLGYLKGTQDIGIVYGCTSDVLTGWCDADYATCTVSRKSRTGYVFSVAGGAVAWQSKLQATVALSTAEAEYTAASHAAKECTWIARIARLLGVHPNHPPVLRVDNQAAIKLAVSGGHSARTKHIDVSVMHIRSAVLRKLLLVEYVNTKDNVADMLTKALAPEQHQRLSKVVGIKK